MRRILSCVAALSLVQSAAASRPLVLAARLEGIVHPAAAQFVERSISRAEREHASLLILEISTPGGLMSSMREITQSIVNSSVPVATYVYPPGARAASAGFFILLSGDVAAMAPGTNTGAAHPVGGQGEDIPKTLNRKIEQDALAQLRTMCAAHHRDARAAEKAVTQSVSYTETEAVANGLVDFVAHDPADLCRKADGMTIQRTNGASVKLDIKNADIEPLAMNPFERLLGAVAEPNVAYLLFLIGIVGLYFELSHPGAILPGVAGGVALLLALYAFSALPVNIAGLALVALGIVFLILEIKTAAHGLLALAGVGCMVLGSALLFTGEVPGEGVRLDVVIPAALVAGGILAALSLRAAAVRRRPVATGAEAMVGALAEAVTDLSPAGRVRIRGEFWRAESRMPVPAGATVRVVAVDGLGLRVEPVGAGSRGEE